MKEIKEGRLKEMGPISKLDKIRQLLEEQGRSKDEAYAILHILLDTIISTLENTKRG